MITMTRDWRWWLLLCLLPCIAQAGIISGLAKLGKKAADDVDVPNTSKLDFDLPEDVAGFKAKAILDDSGQWQLQVPGESKLIAASDFNAIDQAAGGQRLQLILPERDIPRDISGMQNIASNVDVLITSKSRVFKLQRNAPASGGTAMFSLQTPALSVNVPNGAGLTEALWQLQRPWASVPIHTIGLGFGDEIGSSIVNTSVAAVLKKPAALRGQTLVVTDAVDVAALQRAAKEGDWKLVVAQNVPVKKLRQQLDTHYGDASAGFYGSVADFYESMASPLLKNKQKMTLDIQHNQQGQLALLNPVAAKPNKIQQPSDTSSGSYAYVPNPSFLFYGPDEQRQDELDKRLHPSIPSWVHYFLLSSFVLGVIAWKESFIWGRKLWPAGTPPEKWSFGYAAKRLLRMVAYLLYLAVFGWLIFTAAAVRFVLRILRAIGRFIWAIINTLLVKPLRWFVGLFTAK